MDYLEADSPKYLDISQSRVTFGRPATNVNIKNVVQPVVQTVVQSMVQPVVNQVAPVYADPTQVPISVSHVNVPPPIQPIHTPPAPAVFTPAPAAVPEIATTSPQFEAKNLKIEVTASSSGNQVQTSDDAFYILKKGNRDRTRLDEVEKDVPHKFRWRWLYETIELECSENKIIEHHFSECFVKIAKPGCVLCRWCMVECTYGRRGRVALKDHVKTKKHIEELDIRRCTRELPVKRNLEPKRRVNRKIAKKPLADRVASMEALIYSAVSNYSLPASIGPVIVDIARQCCEDPEALSCLFITPAASGCNYKISYRPGDSLSEISLQQLKSIPFSITINDNKKVPEEEPRIRYGPMASRDTRPKYGFSVVASLVFKEGDNQRFVINNLASIEMKLVDSSTMYAALRELFGKYHLPWVNLISLLWESQVPAVTRQCKTKLETRIRNEKTTRLVSADSEACFVIHEMAKAVADSLPVL